MSTPPVIDPSRSGHQEAQRRLELLIEVSRIVTGIDGDINDVVAHVADACVPDFCDLFAVEWLGDADAPTVVTGRVDGVATSRPWTPLGPSWAPDHGAVLGFPHPDEPEPVRVARERLGATAIMVAPIIAGGVPVGRLVAANGPHRRGFRPSALRLAVELGARIGARIEQLALQGERRRIERSLVQAQRLEAMGHVAGRVAHDFNNLLTLIVGYGELLHRSVPGEREKEMLAKINQAAYQAGALTQQMLGFTRQQLDSDAATDIGATVAGLVTVLERLAGTGIELSVRMPPAAVKVRSDPMEVEQIVLNLVINACQAMQGAGKLSICVDAVGVGGGSPDDPGSAPGPYARLRVVDTGPGMSEEIQDRCLEPFFTTKARGEGSGLGLSTVHGLTAERGGTLRIVSEPGSGTTVEVCIPALAGEGLRLPA